jgi:hypothetical protein
MSDPNFAPPGDPIRPDRAWPVWARVLVSLALIFHLTSILVAAFGVPPASHVQLHLREAFTPYFELIDQGTSHRYYSPEPPPTPIVTARLRFDDGRPEQVIRIPDRARAPRLHYQRHLALANHLTNDFQAAKNSPEGPQASVWAASYARHLCRMNPGCSGVTLTTQFHLIPGPEQIRQALIDSGGRPFDVDSEEFYTVPERMGDFACDPR